MGNKNPDRRDGHENRLRISEADKDTLRNALAQIEGIGSWIQITFKPAYATLIDAVKQNVAQNELEQIKAKFVEIVDQSALLNPIFLINDKQINQKFGEFCKERKVCIDDLNFMKDIKAFRYLNYPDFEIADWVNEINHSSFAIKDFLKSAE